MGFKSLLFLVVASVAGASCYRPPYGVRHAPDAADQASWQGVPLIDLETHGYFSTISPEKRELSDGSQMWIFDHCSTWLHDAHCYGSANTVGSLTFANTTCQQAYATKKCCAYQFIVQDNVVQSMRPRGTCSANCGIRPESKIPACTAPAP